MTSALAALLLTAAVPAADDPWPGLERGQADYRQVLERVRREHGGSRPLPPVDFFLFGMGGRPKLLYRAGTLSDARTGRVLHRWDIARELIVPPLYTVALRTRDGRDVVIEEDGASLRLTEGGRTTELARSKVVLPDFAGHPLAPVLRVLHQEMLVNVVDGRPVPNFLVYKKPWYRDGAMMAMAFHKTGNLALVRDWILGLREPYDRNNAGETEADNLGQALYLVSLVANRSHPLVPLVLRELKRFEKGRHVEGRSDFAPHPVYQTRWAKFGLRSLGLDDPYEVPAVADSYASLFWWQPGDGAALKVMDSDDYPYLTWAGSHATGQKRGKLSDRDYPLTWEARASQADYAGMKIVAPVYVDKKLCAPHTWHAAEAFLYLLESGRK